MARHARQQSESEFYHVISRGVGRCIIFENDRDRTRFVNTLARCFDENQVELHAWCLMSNHYHLLVRTAFDKLSQAMKCLNSSYALYYNKRYERPGHLFQGRFKSEPVEDEAYYLSVLRYIHQNPEKAGVCRTKDYPWSSYREYVGEPVITCTDLGLSMLGDVKAFEAFHSKLDDGTPCMDVGNGRGVIDDEDAMRIARRALPNTRIETIAALSKNERDEAIRALRNARLSVRQIERLTGISKSIVGRVAAQ